MKQMYVYIIQAKNLTKDFFFRNINKNKIYILVYINMNDTTDFDDNESRRAFLLTYSQADLSRFNNCKKFAECVLTALHEGKSNKSVLEWACCMEDHADGVGKHFHMAIKLSGTRRWRPVKKPIYEHHGISVNFATENCGYVAAYRCL